MSEQRRRMNIEVNLDTSKLDAQAASATRKVSGILSSVADDKGALAAAKAKVDQLVASVSASGSKLSMPMEQFRAAVKTTSDALDKMTENNAARLDALCPKYDQLKQKMMAAWNSGDNSGFAACQRQVQQLEREIAAREKLGRQIQSQWNDLDRLNSKVEQSAAASKKEEAATLTLAQKLAECRKRMQELAAAGQQGSKEYQELANKAKEYAKSLQQVNADSKPDAQVRLRTALMNAKQAMAEARNKFGEGSVQFQQARDKAIQLQQAMNALNKQVKAMSAPNATYQGIINGLSGISGAASAATGAMALFGGESQQTAQAMAKLQAIMSITMGLQSMSMMLNKNSAAQLNIIGKLTAWWAGCKAKAAASIAAETAALATNTRAEAANAAATNTAAAATQRAAAANASRAVSLRAVGIAIKSIPIIGWIAAIGTLIVSLYKLYKSYDYAKEAKKELHKATKEANKSAAEELATAKALYAATQNHALSMEKRRAAANKMQDLYPSIFKNLKTEAILAGDAAQAYKELTQAILNKAKADARKARVQQIEQQKLDNEADFEKEAEEWIKLANKSLGAYVRAYTVEDIKRNGGLGDRFSTEGNPDLAMAYRNLDVLIEKYLKPNKERQREQDRLAKEITELEETPESERRAATEGDPLYYKRLMEQAQNNADNRLLTPGERTQAQKDYYKYKRLYEKTKFTPISESKEGNADIAAQKIEDTEIKSERERVKKMTELARQLEQARINIMADGAAKRERQRLLDNQREQDSLYNQMQSEIESEASRQKKLWDAREEAKAKAAAAKGKEYRKQAFSSGDILTHDFEPGDTTAGVASGNVDTTHINTILAKYEALQDVTLKAQKMRLESEQEAERLAMQEYLKEYGTYEEKKTAIAAVYAAKRAKATTDAERMKLTQEEKAELDDLDFDDFVTNRAALAFGEIQNLTQATIGDLIVELEKYRDKVTQTFDPEKIEKYNKALAGLKRAQAMGQGNVFSQFFTLDFLKERRAAQAEINEAEIEHNSLLDEKAQKEKEVKEKVEEIIAKVKELTGQDLTAGQVKDGSTVNNIIGQLGQQGGNQQGATDLSGLLDNLGKARTELGNVTTASNKAGNALGQMKETFASKFTGQGGALAMIDTIVHGINGIVQGASETIHELSSTAEALGADTSVGSGWDKATTAIDALSASTEGAAKAWESFKSGNIMGAVAGVVQSFTSIIKGFAALHDASRERTIQQLQDEIDELERLNRRIEHRLESQHSKQAAKSYEEEIRSLEKQRRLIQQQIAAEKDKKNPDDSRIQELEDKLEELGWQIDEYKDKALDAILGEDISTSIGNFADMLVDSWGKAGEKARATKDLVKSMLKQMVIEAMKTDLTGPIKKLREMMAKALEDDVVTETEQKELEAFAQQLARQTEQKYKWADSIMSSSSSQSGATSGSFATASQDSVNELSGRAAAIHTSGEMRRELLLTISRELQELRSRAEAGKENDTEMRSLMLLAVSHLEDISRNTRELYTMNERLEKIEKNTRGL